MGILSSVSTDIEDLVLDGYDDDYIALSIGIDKVVIQPFINHFRYKHNIHLFSLISTSRLSRFITVSASQVVVL